MPGLPDLPNLPDPPDPPGNAGSTGDAGDAGDAGNAGNPGYHFQALGARIVYRERTAPWVRGLCVFFGAVAACVPYPVLRHADQAHSLWDWLVLGLVLAFAGAVALMFWAAALAGGQALDFDPRQRLIHGRARRGFGLIRAQRLGFDQVLRVHLLTRDSEGGRFFQISLDLPQGPPLVVGAFDHRPAAEHWCSRLQALLAVPE